MNLIRVHMTHDRITVEPFPFPPDKFVGGRAVIDYWMTEYVSPTVHPLSEANQFIVAPGLLAGTSAPSSGRLSIGGKSPLTGGIKEANVGGTAGHKLGRLGVQAIVVEGKGKEWQVLRLDSKGAVLEAAGDIVGLDNYDACEKLRQRYGNGIGDPDYRSCRRDEISKFDCRGDGYGRSALSSCCSGRSRGHHGFEVS